MAIYGDDRPIWDFKAIDINQIKFYWGFSHGKSWWFRGF
jgi:hypothetical protein